MFYQRYTECEYLLFKIRMTDVGQIQTNIRLGKYDLVLRHRNKSDKTPWKDISPLIIPKSIAPPDINLYKQQYNPLVEPQMENITQEPPQTTKGVGASNRMENLTNTLSGTISGHLPDNTKRKTTPPPQNESTKKQCHQPTTSSHMETTMQRPNPKQPPGPPATQTNRKHIQPDLINNINDDIDITVNDLVANPTIPGITFIQLE